MRRHLWLLILPLLTLGCAQEEGGPSGSEASGATASKNTLELAGPDDPSKIGLFNDNASIKVGDSWDKAKGAFPEPQRIAYDIHDLPTDIPSEKFEAHGWETPTGEGFGVITYDGKVVVAMYQLENTKQDDLTDFLKLQEQGIGGRADQQFGSRTLQFWFWTDPTAHQTLMVSSLLTARGLNITMAMGDDSVLARLHISETDARRETTQLGPAPVSISGSEPKK